MLKKRIIFTLLYSDGYFVLSRNFRLQRVGTLAWLENNYDFSNVSAYIDELIVLDVSRQERSLERFCNTLQALTQGCFVPIAAGGGVRSVEAARTLLRSGADKVVVNTPLFAAPELVRDLASEFGQQCVVGSIDLKRQNGALVVVTENGSQAVAGAADALDRVDWSTMGEIYLNAVDRDGTGQGYDLSTLDFLPERASVPVILAGGVGNASHLIEGMAQSRVDAVATAHLFNFVGDGLQNARRLVRGAGFELATWLDR